MNKKQGRRDIENYLGSYIRYFDKITNADYERYDNLNLNLGQEDYDVTKPHTYYVVNDDICELYKFLAYFLPYFMNKKSYVRKTLDEIVKENNASFTGNLEESMDNSILIIQIPFTKSVSEKMDKWVNSIVLAKVSERNRRGKTTILLCERPVQDFANSRECILVPLIKNTGKTNYSNSENRSLSNVTVKNSVQDSFI